MTKKATAGQRRGSSVIKNNASTSQETETYTAQLRLRRDQGAVPRAQPLPQAPHLLLSRAQSRFWAFLFIKQSYLVHI
jgi:hypothetical protein